MQAAKTKRKARKTGEQLIDEWGLWIMACNDVGGTGGGDGNNIKETGMTLTDPERNAGDLQGIDFKYEDAREVNRVLRELPTDEFDACYCIRAVGMSQDAFANKKGTTRPKVRELMLLAEGSVYFAINCKK